jgi:hypothetical protein
LALSSPDIALEQHLIMPKTHPGYRGARCLLAAGALAATADAGAAVVAGVTFDPDPQFVVGRQDFVA